jgi:hypothetical protein
MQHYEGFGLPIKLAPGRCNDFRLARCDTTKDSAYPSSWHPGGVTLLGLEDEHNEGFGLPIQLAHKRCSDVRYPKCKSLEDSALQHTFPQDVHHHRHHVVHHRIITIVICISNHVHLTTFVSITRHLPSAIMITIAVKTVMIIVITLTATSSSQP